jgi:cell division initiation protein
VSPEITPNEILQKRFSQGFRGYKPDEVGDFLRLVAAEFEELLRQNMFLQEKVKQLDEAIEEFREMESTLKNTLISSQRVGQEIKEEAERKGNLLMREGELEAERIIQRTRQRKERLEEETFQMLNQHKRFRAEFVALIETHGKMLKAQDSRMLLEFGTNDSGNTPPNEEPDLEPDLEPKQEPQIDESPDSDKLEIDEEKIKDLEILFPEEKK